MGKFSFGPYGSFSGKLGNIVSYLWRGINVNRIRPRKSSKKATEPQLASRKKFSMAQKFVAPLKDYVSVAFHPETRGQARIPQNAASKLFRQHAIYGEYPDFQVDWSKVMMSKGRLSVPADTSVSLQGNVLTFNWKSDLGNRRQSKTDQVMMVAYFPDTLSAEFDVCGAMRYTGTDTLEIWPQDKDRVAETYLAFISYDRQEVSDSVYCGQVVL
ncbi:DUF6266 family protein [Pedobacter sp. JY14-1]|uniref:DUF6266 family protein n=1 Tax=Pedobacter sp. JY14-1 TaxID=3034151 RepID=UPI0023E2BF76|nr:DUF6266 family protein [Pedobacter sp. JY14-1]